MVARIIIEAVAMVFGVTIAGYFLEDGEKIRTLNYYETER